MKIARGAEADPAREVTQDLAASLDPQDLPSRAASLVLVAVHPIRGALAAVHLKGRARRKTTTLVHRIPLHLLLLPRRDLVLGRALLKAAVKRV